MKLMFDTEWYDIIQDLTPDKRVEVMNAILSFPNGDSDTNIWKKVIRPKLEQQADLYRTKCEKFAENRKKRWNRRLTDVCQKSEQICEQKSEQKSIRRENVNVYVNENVNVNENVSVDVSENVSKENSLVLSTTREKRKNKKFIPPTVDEVIAFCSTRDLGEGVAHRIHDYYSAADWHDSTGKPILNWKAKIIAVWDKPENHVKNPDDEPFYL